jgi:hypothetical protein
MKRELAQEVPLGARSKVTSPVASRCRSLASEAASASLSQYNVAAGLLALAVGLQLLPRARNAAAKSVVAGPPRSPSIDVSTSGRAGRRLNRAAGVIAASVLADSAIEHYRGSFHNKAMLAPLITASLSLAASGHGVTDRRTGPHWLRDCAYAAAGLTGLIGTAFHIYNVGKRPGGVGWQNLFYGAPIGAPAALVLSGTMGFLAERVRDTPPGTVPTIAGLPAGRVVAAAVSAGLLGTVGEAGLLHFRGAYQDPFMYLPVTVPPVAAALIGNAALGQTGIRRRATRLLLRLTAALGFAGSGFHIYGVGRGMGGWRNWRQNLLNGPPIPAPPSFTGLALAGLAALGLMEDRPDD